MGTISLNHNKPIKLNHN